MNHAGDGIASPAGSATTVQLVPLFSRFAVVLVAALLCAPGVAMAQASLLAQEGAGVSTQPPVQLGGDDEEPATGATPPAPAPSRPAPAPEAGPLPNTGSDPRMLVLVGVALMLFGVGLRLRTADADVY